jgi:hypothetical protein
MTRLFDELASLPSLERIKQGSGTPLLRNFAHEAVDKEKNVFGEGNLLMRPVGQQVVASALGTLVFDKANPKTLETLTKKLAKFDEEGGFSGIDSEQSPWWGILYDPVRQRMLVSGKSLAIRLLHYLLSGGLEDEARDTLRSDFAEARKISDTRALDMTGNEVELDKVKLPDPL